MEPDHIGAAVSSLSIGSATVGERVIIVEYKTSSEMPIFLIC
jgi:hypothetical protein